MYYFRILERESGSRKFGAFAAVSTGLAAALQWAATHSGGRLPACPSGPYGFIFACFVQYFFQVPPASKMVVLGWRLSDKVFLYLLGLQLLLSGGTSSLLAGGAGLLAGLAYRFNLLGVKKLRFPGFVHRFLASTLGTLLGSDQPAPAPGRTPGVGQLGGAARRAGGSAAAAAVAPGAGRQGLGVMGGGTGAAATAPHLPPPSREAVEQLVAMGFAEAEAARALQLAGNDVQAAIGLLLSA
ncbi:hypothetical protein GPECTOR_87g402 [Gonium pectorale]|uniref:UBA domain-containing protein n=1 Tax=Gonium pectorale TaxID=33097 RepID=A0A150G2K3_GONPE|nr:hypothetical protein GPECTOR_87g402 [Gonium pectorale]|eukprot:KXZ43540.1 hypothetical protein GPECTOR_87g402 [Gonium pectorale]